MKILLLGSRGQLVKGLERELSAVGSVAVFPRAALDITNNCAVTDAVLAILPNIIVNAAAYTAVDKTGTDAERANAVNATAVANLAQIAQKGASSWHKVVKTLIAYAVQQRLKLTMQVAGIQAITTAEYPTAAKRPLNSQLDTGNLQSQMSFDLPHWKDDFLAVASEIIKELETA